MPDENVGPLCFVLMPFGKKPDAAGKTIDFDAVYQQLIAPAVRAAGMTVIRADEEAAGGIIHKAMFERLILCEFAVADLTTANANVFYELGVRHAVRPWSTLSILAQGSRPPFDLGPLRCIPYMLSADGLPDNVKATSDMLASRLKTLRDTVRTQPEAASDSPVFALVNGMREQEIDESQTDVFRKEVLDSQALKERLADARDNKSADEIRAVEAGLGNLQDADSGVVVELLLSYRSLKSWDDMIRLVDSIARPLAESVLVLQEYALALNRKNEGKKAERVLKDLIEKRGPSSESYGILGRVYKDRWKKAKDDPERKEEASGLLDDAIDAYAKGFESDSRDAFPGINAVTLMSVRDPADKRIAELLPVVSYAVERRIARGKPDYWDYATRLELAVNSRDRAKTSEALKATLSAVRDAFQPDSTADNLTLLRDAGKARGEDVGWIDDAIRALKKKC